MTIASNYDNLLKRYAFYAPRYDRLFRRYSAATLGKALDVVPLEEKSWLLDVACGTGLFAEMLLKERPNLHVTGVDVSEDMLGHARQRVPGRSGKVEWLVGFAESLPVPTAKYDVLTCTNAFHLVQDAEAALADFRRALKPGGTLVLVDWCLDFPSMRVRNAALKIGDRQRRQIRRLRDLAALVKVAGFAIDTEERFTPSPLWGMMCIVGKKSVLTSTPHFDVSHLQPAQR